ncbi:MAG: glycerophosphodiester phosphodiesterase, partial [Burkholderiales bacterium]
MKVIGHRGAAAHAPENTLESFAVAIDLGVDAIETDVQETDDGELVLIHDKTLDRTTNGKGLVRKTPWAVIESLDAGSWFASRFRGAKVPLLRDALQQYGSRTKLVLEIKRVKSGLKALDMVREFGLVDRLTFTSFELKVLKKIRKREPAAKAGFISSKVDDARLALEAGVN